MRREVRDAPLRLFSIYLEPLKPGINTKSLCPRPLVHGFKQTAVITLFADNFSDRHNWRRDVRKERERLLKICFLCRLVAFK